ncbi:CHAD domain-containing protein [Agromyces hippuratus]|uniref:CHAD domain-containing protein n=1 Tax=Agromyces hippuratus TaxID=286438 RepID=A0A852X0D7_9MICO|nr:CHAD domain-containing protein [Agromyces hippuratus]NYG19621.1 CHAD domain-containing protein [Agromyces hippuratus]
MALDDAGDHDDAGAVVLAALRAIAARLDEIEPAAVADEPDAVHRLRTNVRRLRSVIAVYGSLFDASEVDAVRRRYRELGRRLGAVRDLEVRLLVAEGALRDAAASADSDPVVLAPVMARLIAAATASHQLAHQDFVEHEARPGASRRRADLDELLTDAPATRLAGAAAGPVLGALLAREARRAVIRASGVDATSTLAQLHSVRRAGRRLRYAAEALSDSPDTTFDAPMGSLAAAGQGVQDVIGDHRDELLFASYLRDSAAVAGRSEPDRAVLEQLADAAQQRAAARIAGLEAAVRELRRAEQDWLLL